MFLKTIIYLLFNKNEIYKGCSCDVDCMCEWSFYNNRNKKINKWFRFRKD